jgi:hypothetical protein
MFKTPAEQDAEGERAGDYDIRTLAGLRPWLNDWGREQAGRITRQVESLITRLEAPKPMRLRIHYATEEEIEALRDQGFIRGQVAAGMPIFVPADVDLPVDWSYRAREYVEFSE